MILIDFKMFVLGIGLGLIGLWIQTKPPVNSVLQWAGTLALITMYIIMSFYPEAYPLNIWAGLVGGTLYNIWSIRTKNRPQIIVNSAGMIVCIMGLYRAY